MYASGATPVQRLLAASFHFADDGTANKTFMYVSLATERSGLFGIRQAHTTADRPALLGVVK